MNFLVTGATGSIGRVSQKLDKLLDTKSSDLFDRILQSTKRRMA